MTFIIINSPAAAESKVFISNCCHLLFYDVDVVGFLIMSVIVSMDVLYLNFLFKKKSNE
jgi:hypothetical protein